MVEMSGIYKGQKHCDLTHGPSGALISTDAPKDNHGRGESFSPTDLVAAALGACMLTIMAIQAEKKGLDLKESSFHVSKEMQEGPRKISRLALTLQLPSCIGLADRKDLEVAAITCPVHRSLHPDIQIPVTFAWEI